MEMQQQVTIDNQIFNVLDVKEKVTIADSFVVRSNKIGTGNGEAKLYVGNESDELRNFFGIRPFLINCFLLKKDLIKYLNDTKIEYQKPEQLYQDRNDFPRLFQERLSTVDSLQDNVVRFSAKEQDQITGPRIYRNSSDSFYQILRELSLPNITHISILKLQNTQTNEISFYFKLFADYFGEVEHPAIIEEEVLSTVDTQVVKARKGHGVYRSKLLEQCPYCPITMITDDRLLIASHIKPWVDSDTFEKTDPYNGFMLSPTFDFLFDRGFMSFTDDKKVMLSPFLSKITYSKIGISDNKNIPMLPVEGREEYLKYHRENIFKSGGDI